MLDIFYVVAGLALILVGANGLTDGAASIAKRLNIPSLVIGLTVVAFGTSAPELVVSATSALKGSADMAVGNVVGSNLFNTLMIVGMTALFAPISIQKNTISREIPFSLLASVVVIVCANDILLDGSTKDLISRTDGLLLLGFFIIFLVYTFIIARKGNESGATEGEEVVSMSWLKSIIYLLLGFGGLIYGGQLFVDGSINVARSLGVSESVIALTLVAGGTSLPELATSVVAAMKKNPDIAIGNVVGSNLFNVFFVLGTSATITPLAINGIDNFDFIVLIASSLLLVVFAVMFGKRMITRVEGGILVLLHIAYILFSLYK
ncbi:MAG: calcium/sodium antiporter [Bacteroides sp.]|nr:calcium/sodium antiporter [Bacteroides sp.]